MNVATIGKALRLYAASLLLSSLSGASSPGVEMALLVDAAQLSAGDNARHAQGFLRDLLDNLPPRVTLHAWQFCGSPELISCDTAFQCLREIPAEEGGRLTLQQALSKAEVLLCQMGAAPDFPGRALVVMSGSGGERLALAGQCRIELVALGMSPGGDPALSEMAGRKAFFPLSKARGYTVASRIRTTVWEPAVRWELNRRDDNLEAPPLVGLGSGLAASLALFCFALLHLARRGRRAPAEPRPARPAPPREADLRICSGAGSGTVFPLNGRQPVILGGTRHATRSRADLLIDDPGVAGEHCRIRAEGNDFFVDDLGSGQGTFVNEEQVAGRKVLAPADRLRIGGTTFEILYR